MLVQRISHSLQTRLEQTHEDTKQALVCAAALRNGASRRHIAIRGPQLVLCLLRLRRRNTALRLLSPSIVPVTAGPPCFRDGHRHCSRPRYPAHRELAVLCAVLRAPGPASLRTPVHTSHAEVPQRAAHFPESHAACACTQRCAARLSTHLPTTHLCVHAGWHRTQSQETEFRCAACRTPEPERDRRAVVVKHRRRQQLPAKWRGSARGRSP